MAMGCSVRVVCTVAFLQGLLSTGICQVNETDDVGGEDVSEAPAELADVRGPVAVVTLLIWLLVILAVIVVYWRRSFPCLRRWFGKTSESERGPNRAVQMGVITSYPPPAENLGPDRAIPSPDLPPDGDEQYTRLNDHGENGPSSGNQGGEPLHQGAINKTHTSDSGKEDGHYQTLSVDQEEGTGLQTAAVPPEQQSPYEHLNAQNQKDDQRPYATLNTKM